MAPSLTVRGPSQKPVQRPSSLLLAFARYRWWRTKGQMRSDRRSDALAQIGRWLAPALRLFFWLALIPTALGIAVLAFLFGWTLASGELAVTPAFLIMLRGGLVVLTAMTVLVPLILGSRGVEGENRRFLLLPISRTWLHGLRFSATLADPWNLAGLIASLFLPIGLIVGSLLRPADAIGDFSLTRALGGACLIGMAALLMVLANAALGFLITLKVQNLLRDRRRANAALMLGIFGLMALSLVTPWLEESETENDISAAILILNPFAELFVTVLQSSLSAAIPRALLSLSALAASLFGLFWLNQKAHDRLLLEGGKVTARRSAATSSSPSREWHLPGISRAATTVAKVQLLTLWRTVPGKMAIAQAPFLVLLAGFLLPRIMQGTWIYAGLGSEILLIAISMSFMLIGMQQFIFNNYVIDGAGLTRQILLPLPARELLCGKAAAWSLLLAATLLVSTPLAFVFARPGWISVIMSPVLIGLATASSAALLIPSGLILSALFPKEADLSRSIQGNQPHPLSIFIGLAILGPSWGIPLAIIGFGAIRLQSLSWVLFGLLVWLGLCLVAGHFLMKLAQATWQRRREMILLETLTR